MCSFDRWNISIHFPLIRPLVASIDTMQYFARYTYMYVRAEQILSHPLAAMVANHIIYDHCSCY